MQIILMEKVINLGSLGDVVKVKDGFARNFLIPQGKAKRATEANKASSKAGVPTWKRKRPRSSPRPMRAPKNSKAIWFRSRKRPVSMAACSAQ